jgi:hypothetical protein
MQDMLVGKTHGAHRLVRMAAMRWAKSEAWLLAAAIEKRPPSTIPPSSARAAPAGRGDGGGHAARQLGQHVLMA